MGRAVVKSQTSLNLPIDNICGAVQKNDEKMNVAGVFAFRGTQPWSLSDWLIDFDYEKKAVDWWKDPEDYKRTAGDISYKPADGKVNGTTEPSKPKEPMVCVVPSVHQTCKDQCLSVDVLPVMGLPFVVAL